MKYFIYALLFLLQTQVFAKDLRGRLGIGATNQLANEMPALSFKIQQSKSFALGGVMGLRSDQDNTLYGFGAKFYRIIFDEPQLNFYLAGLFATQTYLNEKNEVESGFQVDGVFGTEFHLSGLDSIGFSFEFGLSARNSRNTSGTSIQTLGDQFIRSAIHFYL